MSPDDFFEGVPLGRAVFDRVCAILAPLDPEVRVSRSQIAFRTGRSFAWLWRPSQYLGKRGADVVLELALGRADPSPRWKEVVQPAPGRWVHHLEVRDVAALDDEVRAWLYEAATGAGAHRQDGQSPS